MKYKNYYKILDLDSSRVSMDEIKSSYRKLTKKFHPDINKGYEEKFKDITEAYQTLSDSKLRKKYNVRYYMHFMQNGVRLSLSKDKLEEFKNSEFVKIFIGEFKEETAQKDNILAKNEDEILLNLTLEEAFQGAIKEVMLTFPEEDERTIKVRVPRGATNDSKVLLREEGQKDKFSGVRKDLNIKICLAESKKYTLDGNNLLKEIKISPSEAVLGSERSITSIDGVYKLKIPEGVQNGEVLTIKDAGFINRNGKRGDFLATIVIDIPKELTAEEKALYAKLRKISP